MLTSRYKSLFNRCLEPLAKGLIRCGVSPNVLTLGGLTGSVIVCLWFVRTKAVIPFCVAILVVGCVDALDGAVARACGRVTKFGAYLDAVCDRYVEVIVAGSVAYVTGHWLLIGVVLVGSLLVSYAKARAAMEVAVSNQEWPDLMERTERDVIFIVGLAAGTLIAWRPLGHDLFWWTLVVLAVMIHLTVVQRILRARRFILDRSA